MILNCSTLTKQTLSASTMNKCSFYFKHFDFLSSTASASKLRLRCSSFSSRAVLERKNNNNDNNHLSTMSTSSLLFCYHVGPQILLSNDNLCSKRFFSKTNRYCEGSGSNSGRSRKENENNASRDDDDRNSNIQTDSGSKETEKPSDSSLGLDKDPWIKSLMAEIRKDFDQNQDSNNSTDTSVKDGDSGNIKSVEVESSSSLNTSQTQSPSTKENALGESLDLDQYEYDYRIADDIEEYGYFTGESEKSEQPEKQLPISFNRGKTGVFDLEELLTLMDHLGADHVVDFPIPVEANYCDHMIIVTAKSKRHLQAINTEMLWVHKRKKSRRDPNLHIEGLERSDWCAMDLGNVVLHVFLNEETRQYYDIESLWTLGPELDPKCQEARNDNFVLSAEDLFWMDVDGKSSKSQSNSVEQSDNLKPATH